MKKAEAELSIRNLCHDWGKIQNIPRQPNSDPSFSEFMTWVHDQGYGYCLEFRSVRGARSDVEHWFNEEFRQRWRN